VVDWLQTEMVYHPYKYWLGSTVSPRRRHRTGIVCVTKLCVVLYRITC